MDRGYTYLKMDLGVQLVQKTSGTVTSPKEVELRTSEHPFTGIEITGKGIAMMADYVAQVRDAVGMEIPLAADHFGHIGVNSCIRLAKALEKYNMAWLEDGAVVLHGSAQEDHRRRGRANPDRRGHLPQGRSLPSSATLTRST